MSIAAISSSFVAATRTIATAAPVDPAAATQGARHEGGRRHQLVDAMNQALGQSGPQSKAAEQAVFRFAHALMHDLRSIDADASRPGPGRGVAWGQRNWSDLPQRIDTLATAAAAAPEVPQQPNPLTTTSAALHLMQVPSSRLLEAFAALRQALGEQQAPTAPAPTDTRGELAAFLDRLSDTLAPDTQAAIPAGSVLHVTA